jgi:hypothetical protein
MASDKPSNMNRDMPGDDGITPGFFGAGDQAGIIIDCDCCAMRNTSACDDCVVSHLLTAGRQPVELSRAESSALDALADQGLVPRLRLILRDRSLDPVIDDPVIDAAEAG